MSNDDDIDDVFDDDDFADGGFDDLNDNSNTLGDLWRNNPLVKVGVILLALAFLVGGIIIFGGKPDPSNPSRLRTARDANEAPGTSEISETMRQAIEEENKTRIEEAQRTGTSAVPMPVEAPKGTIGLQIDRSEEEDPLDRWRRMQERRIKEQQIKPQEPPPPPPPPEPEVDLKTPAINALAEAMASQMQSVLSAQQISTPQLSNVASIQYLEALQAAEQAKLDAELAEAQAQLELASGDTAIDDLNIILPAGTIEYAQVVTAVSTDAPGPVLAEIVTGPLRGARAIGTFNAQYNYLTLRFNTLVLDGVDFSANGIALDPSTTLPGVVTNIDRRYFKRVVLPAAAQFIEGFADAIARSGQTSVTITGDTVTETTSTDDIDVGEALASGIREAGDQVADAVDDVADRTEQLLEIAPGTPIGILFVSPVIGTPNVILQRDLQEPSPGVDLGNPTLDVQSISNIGNIVPIPAQ